MSTTKRISVSRVLISLGLLSLLLSCQNYNDSYAEEVSMESTGINADFKVVETDESAGMSNPLEDSEANTAIDLKIIKSANARYKVTDVKEATKKIKAIARKYQGYVSDLRYQNTLYRIENRFTIKVPHQNFDVVMDSISAVAEFTEEESITTKDITEEYVDLQSRLKTKLEVQARYEEILRSKARTVEEVLKTEDKLRIIQEEIESAQGRLKYLSNKVAFSTIQVDLYETVEYTEEPDTYTKTFGDKAKNGFSFGWNMIESALLFLVYIWPVWIVVIGLFLFLRRRWKS